jgi:K(+)-stimulated pyrophosphate-energized sodium pump
MSGNILVFIVGISVLTLVFVALLARWVLAQDTGTAEMRAISDAIKEGAEAFLRRQYKTIYFMAALIFVALFLLYLHSGFSIAWKTAVAFLLGSVCSGFAGFIGMFISIRANIRTASAARTSLNRALQTALRGGAVSGLTVISTALLGMGLLFWFYGGLVHPTLVPDQMVGFAFGASLVALFAQLGGGIYTKAADVGADLVGKVEAGIPEDDPRNPAVIADLVGDNVGDCAGRGADLFESTAAENIGALILGVALTKAFGAQGILFPLVACAFGLIASIIGVMSVRMREDEDPMTPLNRGFLITSVLATGLFYIAVRWLLHGNLWLFASGVVGIVTSYAFVWITQYYTESCYRPVRTIARSSMTGSATNIITGLSVGMECTGLPVLTICVALLVSYYFGYRALGNTSAGGYYGTAIATMGMLSSAAYILAMDTFGPITDNAGGVVEMSHQPDDVRARTDRLDSVGNTTKALTKGYAIGSAALAAFLLFNAYLDRVRELVPLFNRVVDITIVPVFAGALIGAMLVFVFSALAIRAVGKSSQYVIEEVRRQFRENKCIMEGTGKPDYRACVDIVTAGSLRAMVPPGVLAVGVPAAVGVIFRSFNGMYGPEVSAESVAALLMVGTVVGILMALLMNNGGGAWDNAKKWIETGELGGKASEAHKAAVVGDTVGDPFKDTAGPSLHILIKLLSTITLVLAPLFI